MTSSHPAPAPDASKQTAAIQYPPATVARADRALRCTAFQKPLFAAMRQQSVGLKAIAGVAGVQNRYSSRPLPELAAESDLLWLIQVGVLRREVDGQGLTDSFRLTPLGHQLCETLPEALSPPTLGDRLYNAVSRRLRLPI